MRNQAVPDHSLECLGMGSDAHRRHIGDYHYAIADFFRGDAFSPVNTQDLGAARFHFRKPGDDIGDVIAFQVTTHRVYQHGVFGISLADFVNQDPDVNSDTSYFGKRPEKAPQTGCLFSQSFAEGPVRSVFWRSGGVADTS